MSSLVLVKKNAVYWYFTNKDPVVCLVPNTALRDMEVLNEQEMGENIRKCLGKISTDPTAPTIVALSDEVCFSVVLIHGKEHEGIKRLNTLMPFARAEVITLRTKDQSVAVGTNRDLYEIIARIVASHGFEVILVIPWAALAVLGISKDGELDRVTVRRAFDAAAALKPFAFPFTDEGAFFPSVSLAPPKLTSHKISIGWIIFVIVASLYAVGILWYMRS